MRAHKDVMRLHEQVCLASSVVESRIPSYQGTGNRIQDNQASDIFASSLSVFGPTAMEFRRPAAALVRHMVIAIASILVDTVL